MEILRGRQGSKDNDAPPPASAAQLARSSVAQASSSRSL
eukprot:CAMPEP_0180534934 /NCGR_PEP_ID=MMETSP1036_2-20121128/64457_1 /TAXON_ID=632150 /ORGANISM="Azadinium spinosum, Strain 3D9" /LENGTH=38 /DNA_ID= /DNA_START= /DNA_END= /DNA_ORIENTATION=